MLLQLIRGHLFVRGRSQGKNLELAGPSRSVGLETLRTARVEPHKVALRRSSVAVEERAGGADGEKTVVILNALQPDAVRVSHRLSVGPHSVRCNHFPPRSFLAMCRQACLHGRRILLGDILNLRQELAAGILYLDDAAVVDHLSVGTRRFSSIGSPLVRQEPFNGCSLLREDSVWLPLLLAVLLYGLCRRVRQLRSEKEASAVLVVVQDCGVEPFASVDVDSGGDVRVGSHQATEVRYHQTNTVPKRHDLARFHAERYFLFWYAGQFQLPTAEVVPG
mmetsp:Transcript_27560/g.56478  ORF Transcript_27560/g.56478 Transcript_27560/m.56478 type:complete len:278 (-) Transcript_27560:242-1075(-)